MLYTSISVCSKEREKKSPLAPTCNGKEKRLAGKTPRNRGLGVGVGGDCLFQDSNENGGIGTVNAV